MRRTPAAPPLAAIDRRTLLARAKDELTESLREHGDATAVAIVLRFVDQQAATLPARTTSNT